MHQDLPSSQAFVPGYCWTIVQSDSDSDNWWYIQTIIYWEATSSYKKNKLSIWILWTLGVPGGGAWGLDGDRNWTYKGEKIDMEDLEGNINRADAEKTFQAVFLVFNALFSSSKQNSVANSNDTAAYIVKISYKQLYSGTYLKKKTL